MHNTLNRGGDADRILHSLRYVGKIPPLSQNETGGDGETEHYDYAQGHFEQCIPTLGCTESRYPTIRKWQYGDGTHTYQTTD